MLKVGDKVKVRKWNDMANEYGVNYEGEIEIGGTSFVTNMTQYCGQVVTISKVYEDGRYECVGNEWEWVDGMFEYQPKHAMETVDHPSHYNQGIEAIDYIESHEMNFNIGNVIKYITRAKHKGNELEDLKKARWYLDREIERLNNGR